LPLVRHLSTLGIQSLMEELDRVSESPALALALEHSSSLTVEQKISSTNFTAREILSTKPHSRKPQRAGVEPDAVRRQTLIQRLAKMTVAQRVTICDERAARRRAAR